MSWSAKVAGKPAEALERFTGQVTASWGYTHSAVEKENIDQVIAYLTARVNYFTSNGVLTTIVELEGSGHWDDASGQGNCTVSFRILTDRRKS